MRFLIAKTFAQAPSVDIIPLESGDSLASQLEQIKQQRGLAGNFPFKADEKEIMPMYHATGTTYLLGLGKNAEWHTVLTSFRRIFHKNAAQWGESVGVDLTFVGQAQVAMVAEALSNGFEMAYYRIGRFKQEPDKPVAVEDVWVKHAATQLQAALDRGQHAGVVQRRAMAMVDAPANKLRPVDLAAWASEGGANLGYDVQVWHRKEIIENGLHALAAVAQGSVTEPAFIVASYTPQGANDLTPSVALVGKGITFDTGGLSIKTSNMHYMKSDMGGAAAVIGAIELIARWKLPVRVYAVVPSSENDVDANAYKPGDIIGSYSGKTIEVIDTDAEGRLVLADGLSYIVRKHHPEVVIDVATLTGNAVMALGYYAGALLSHSDSLAQAIYEAGLATGEKVWRMPLWDIYGEEMLSEIADVRNYSGRSLSGCITAAKFLEHFVDKHPRWAHIDIAGVAFGDSEFSKAKSGTAFGIRLLAHFVEMVGKNGLP